jgi:hypothetical protein
MLLEFNLNNAEEGELFPFQNSTIDDKGDIVWDDPILDHTTKKPIAMVGIRSMTPFFEERIKERKMVVEHVFNPKSKGMDRDRHPKDLTFEEAQAERNDAYDYAITSLEGFKAKGGGVITCTRENKLALMKNPVFDRFFAKCQQMLANSSVEQVEMESKN